MFSLLQKQLSQELKSKNLFPITPIIRSETELTHCCEQKLIVQKTVKRDIVTLNIGKICVHKTIKQCRICKQIYRPEDLCQLVPQFCNFGFDVIVYVGEAFFQKHQTESEIVNELRKKNVIISEREVSYLSKKFVCYLFFAHREKIPEIRQLIEKNGGFCLHFDGTSEGASPHLLVAVDEIEQLVLGSVKAVSESTESVSSLLHQVKEDYGDPLSAVHDLGRANLSAMKNVYPNIPDYICHYHFLRDIGKDLFEYEDSQIRSILKAYGVKGHLQTLAKKLRRYVNMDLLKLPKGKKHLFPQDVSRLTEHNIAYILTEWILDFKEELSGYGFPFDREKLVFINRMQKVKDLLATLMPQGGYMEILQQELEVVLEDTMLIQFVTKMMMKVQHFDQLRKALRIAMPGETDGLNDDGLHYDMEEIKKDVKRFINSEEIQEAAEHDNKYKKVLDQIDKYWDKLFTKPITVIAQNGSKITIQPQRTNNLMERFFRELNRGCRKRTGGKSLGKVLVTMIAETPLIKNLENKKYKTIILNGCSSLAERFSEIEANFVREKMEDALKEMQKLHPAVKKLIRLSKLPDWLVKICEPILKHA